MSTAKEGLVNELHRPARRNYPRRKVRIFGIDDLWQADLVEMIPYAAQNGNYKYLLTVIDTFSKYAWAKPLKTKKGKDVTAAMQEIFDTSERSPKHLQVDQGTEFYNSNLERLLQERNINLYSTYSGTKASIIERFNRTLKTRMWKRFSLQGSYKWTDLLPTLLEEYNERSVHRSIGMRPADVTEDHTDFILRRLSQLVPTKKPKLKTGDYVRLSKVKSLFEKGYTPNWGTELFRVVTVQPTRPITYLLEDLKGNPVKGGFYSEELQKTRFKDIYLVEKVLRRNGDKARVKWLGFDSSHNSWINTREIV